MVPECGSILAGFVPAFVDEQACHNPAMARFATGRWMGFASCAALLVLFVFGFRTLLRTPCLGVADIDDFWRVMRPAGISHIRPLFKPGRHVVCTFKTGDSDLGSSPSSAALVAWGAKHLGWGLRPKPNRMDLRQMGRLCLSIVLLIVVASLLNRTPPLLVGLMMYVLVDPGYLLFFNSFYADAVFFIALFGTVLWLVRFGKLDREFWQLDCPTWIAVFLGIGGLALLGGASKMQYVLFPAFLSVCLTPQIVINGRRSTVRALSLGTMLVLLSALLPLLCFCGPRPGVLWANNYHAVYGGICRVASDRQGVLEALGVPRQYWNLPQTDVWSAGVSSSHPVHQHLRDLSRAKLLLLYAGDPAAVRKVMRHIETALTSVATDSRGHLVRDAAHRKRSLYSTWWQFSRIHASLYRAWPPFIWLLLTGTAARIGIAVARGRVDGLTVSEAFLVLWASCQLVIIVLGEGLINLKAHLVGTRLALDFLLVLVLWDTTRVLVIRWLERRVRTTDGAAAQLGDGVAAATSAVNELRDWKAPPDHITASDSQ
jgi:hypothetical protein